ncbi:hypothetical protein [Streptomyces sp. G45]|uniref:hypothetical protein n=1 Tax=Streptomyces sp. G45 TaxID=3406627 RepID=UPI003C281D36
MTARTGQRKAPTPPETGWAKARRGKGTGVRTCVAAVVRTGGCPPPARVSPEGNIVRGDD